MEKSEYNSITASASVTNKSENQDSHFGLENALIVTDGLGSFQQARAAAISVSESFRSEILAKGGKVNIHDLFKLAKDDLIEIARANDREMQSEQQVNLYATTAIVAIEEEEIFRCGYVGNGAIWHIRGNFNEFPDAYLFPWNAINYLNPHSIPEGGKEALYRFIAESEFYEEAVPTVIEISKDKHFGDIIMICSDGIYSADHFNAGTNSKGVWVKYEETMLKFFKFLNSYFSGAVTAGKESLQEALHAFLEDIKPIIDDDATLAILISKEAFAYQDNKRLNLEKPEYDLMTDKQTGPQGQSENEGINNLDSSKEQQNEDNS